MKATEIVPGLWVGSLQDAEFQQTPQVRDAYRVCVTDREEFRQYDRCPKKMRVNVPILIYEKDDPTFGRVIRADPSALDRAATVIAKGMRAHGNVLVHCAAGLERSPLAVMWFLAKTTGMNLDDAYELVKKTRRSVFDRRNWLLGATPTR